MTTRLPLITLLALLVVNYVSSASPIPDFPFIAADGSASREVAPTNASIHFTVLAFSKSSEEATNTVQTALGNVVTALKAEGVGEKMIRSHDIDKSAVRSRDNNANKALEILGYEVSRKVELKLPDLANYPKIIRVLMTADHIANMSSNFDTSTREDVEAELTGEACIKARKKADLLAKGAGVTIDRVYAVSNNSLEAIGQQFDLRNSGGGVDYFSSNDAPEILLFVPSTIELSASVNILYKLAP
ncbi:MAG: SIMPL domain-containing protein [Luteolibacter sp.]